MSHSYRGLRNTIGRNPLRGTRKFSPEQRLRNKPEFDRVLRHSTLKLRVGCLQALLTPNDRCEPRLGLIIAKRHLRLAVQRNRVKRLIREMFRCCAVKLPRFDIVIRLAHPPDLELLGGEIGQLFGKMLQLKNERPPTQ